jgi:hypothetical protein
MSNTLKRLAAVAAVVGLGAVAGRVATTNHDPGTTVRVGPADLTITGRWQRLGPDKLARGSDRLLVTLIPTAQPTLGAAGPAGSSAGGGSAGAVGSGAARANAGSAGSGAGGTNGGAAENGAAGANAGAAGSGAGGAAGSGAAGVSASGAAAASPVPRVPGTGAPGRARLGGYDAWRYGNARVLPTTRGALVVECRCGDAVKAVSLPGARVLEPVPDLALRLRAPAAFARLDAIRTQERSVWTPASAARLAAAHRAVLDDLGALAPPPLAGALEDAIGAYDELARTPAASPTRLTATDHALEAAVARLARSGAPRVQKPTSADGGVASWLVLVAAALAAVLAGALAPAALRRLRGQRPARRDDRGALADGPVAPDERVGHAGHAPGPAEADEAPNAPAPAAMPGRAARATNGGEAAVGPAREDRDTIAAPAPAAVPGQAARGANASPTPAAVPRRAGSGTIAAPARAPAAVPAAAPTLDPAPAPAAAAYGRWDEAPAGAVLEDDAREAATASSSTA